MLPKIIDFIRRARAELAPSAPGRVLEVGARDVNGSPRSEFQDAALYLGVDIEHGPGVDLLCDGERLTELFPPNGFNAVICTEVLEHCVRPWVIVDGMRTLLAPNGLMWVSTPTFGFPEHKYPVDCYRFGEDAYRLWMFAGMELLRLEHLTDDSGLPCIAAVGRKR